eukprot:jgi/Mesvir1/14011/Mv02857-RA.1
MSVSCHVSSDSAPRQSAPRRFRRVSVTKICHDSQRTVPSDTCPICQSAMTVPDRNAIGIFYSFFAGWNPSDDLFDHNDYDHLDDAGTEVNSHAAIDDLVAQSRPAAAPIVCVFSFACRPAAWWPSSRSRSGGAGPSGGDLAALQRQLRETQEELERERNRSRRRSFSPDPTREELKKMRLALEEANHKITWFEKRLACCDICTEPFGTEGKYPIIYLVEGVHTCVPQHCNKCADMLEAHALEYNSTRPNARVIGKRCPECKELLMRTGSQYKRNVGVDRLTFTLVNVRLCARGCGGEVVFGEEAIHDNTCAKLVRPCPNKLSLPGDNGTVTILGCTYQATSREDLDRHLRVVDNYIRDHPQLECSGSAGNALAVAFFEALGGGVGWDALAMRRLVDRFRDGARRIVERDAHLVADVQHREVIVVEDE